VVSGLVIFLTGWSWLDPIVSLAIAAMILLSTWGLLRDSLDMALDKVPEGVDAEKVKNFLAALPDVTEVHDLHIWPLSTTKTALTVHLVRPLASIDNAFLHNACKELEQHFGISHATFQIENADPSHPCHLAPANVI
jgi:cobalt-zinc-cadmium efflux system protein